MDKFLVLFRVILRSALMASVIFITIFHFFGGFIYHFWLRKTVPFQQPVMDLFLIYMAQFIFWLTCSHPLQATNRHHTLSKMLFAASILTIGSGLSGRTAPRVAGDCAGHDYRGPGPAFLGGPVSVEGLSCLFLLQVFCHRDGAVYRKSGYSGDHSLARPDCLSLTPGMVAEGGPRPNPETGLLAATQIVWQFIRARRSNASHGGFVMGIAERPVQS